MNKISKTCKTNKTCKTSFQFSECGNNGISDTQFIVGARNDPEKNPVGHWPWIASIGIYDDKKRLLR